MARGSPSAAWMSSSSALSSKGLYQVIPMRLLLVHGGRRARPGGAKEEEQTYVRMLRPENVSQSSTG
jgi:hypothetical protein